MKPATYWITGQPGSGKTTLGKALTDFLLSQGVPAVHLDGDIWRSLLENLDYSAEGRRRNVVTAQKVAAFLNGFGVFVVASFVSPVREIREAFKAAHSVTELYTHTSEMRGREGYFVKRYQPPLAEFVDVDTTERSVEDTLAFLIEQLGLDKLQPLAR